MRRLALSLGIILGFANLVVADPWLYIDTGAGRERYYRLPTLYMAGESVMVGVLVRIAVVGATTIIEKMRQPR